VSELSSIDAAREQAVLAWRRTALRWVVVAVVAARFFTEEIGWPLVAFTLVVILAAVALNFVVSREYSAVSTGSGVPSPGMPDALRKPAVRLGILAVATGALCVVALAWAITYSPA
jgi:hypothetical protein